MEKAKRAKSQFFLRTSIVHQTEMLQHLLSSSYVDLMKRESSGVVSSALQSHDTGRMFGKALKTLPGVSASHFRMLGFKLWLYFHSSFFFMHIPGGSCDDSSTWFLATH